MKRIKSISAIILAIALVVCSISLYPTPSAAAEVEEEVIYNTSFSDGDVASNGLIELGGHPTYYFSFDWELLYDTTDGAEIYFVVDSADGSTHHHMHRFAIDEQDAGTTGYEEIVWDFFGKPNMGYGGEHGAIVSTEPKLIRFLVKNVGGFSIDNFEIRKDDEDGEIVFSTDFSEDKLPEAFQTDEGNYDFAGVRDGKFVAEFKDGVVGNPNYHLSALNINSEVLPLIWRGSGFETVEVSDGYYTVDNGGEAVCDDGYFPFLEINPNKVELKWGVGNSYHVSFDYKFNYSNYGEVFLRLETADGKVTGKQIEVSNPKEINSWENFSVTIDANGKGDFDDSIAIDTPMMLRLINKELEGISIDNITITKFYSGFEAELESVLENDFSTSDISGLLELGGVNYLSVSFDYTLPYGAPEGSEIYFVVDTLDGSRHMYMNRIHEGQKAEGFVGKCELVIELCGKGTDIHGLYNKSNQIVCAKLLAQRLAGLTIDNLEIKDTATGKEFVKGDFEDGMPQGLDNLSGKTDFAFHDVRDGAYVIDNNGSIVDGWNTIISVSQSQNIAWGGGSNFKTAGSKDGKYVVDHDGQTRNQGYYTPVFEIDTDKIPLIWGQGYTYTIDFDWCLPNGSDGGMYSYFCMDVLEDQNKHIGGMNLFVSGSNSAGKSGHLKQSWDLYGDDLAPGTEMTFRILANTLKGLEIDNLKIIRQKTAEADVVEEAEIKILLDTDFSKMPEELVTLESFGGYKSISVVDGQYVANSDGEVVSNGFSTIFMTNPYTFQLFWGTDSKYRIEFDYTLPYGANKTSTEFYLVADPLGINDTHGTMDLFVSGINDSKEVRHYLKDFEFYGTPKYWTDSNVIPDDTLMYFLLLVKDGSGVVIDNLKITDLNYKEREYVDPDLPIETTPAQDVDVSVFILDENDNPVKQQYVRLDSENPVQTNNNGGVVFKTVSDGSHTISLTDKDGNSLAEDYFTIRGGDELILNGSFATIDKSVTGLTVTLKYVDSRLKVNKIDVGLTDIGIDVPEDDPQATPSDIDNNGSNDDPVHKKNTSWLIPLIIGVVVIVAAVVAIVIASSRKKKKV